MVPHHLFKRFKCTRMLLDPATCSCEQGIPDISGIQFFGVTKCHTVLGQGPYKPSFEHIQSAAVNRAAKPVVLLFFNNIIGFLYYAMVTTIFLYLLGLFPPTGMHIASACLVEHVFSM